MRPDGRTTARLPPVRILSHYFVARFLGLFVMVLAAALLALGAIELVLGLDELAGSDAPGPGDAGSVLRRLALRLSTYYLVDLLPMASFVAVFLALALAGRSREMLAVQAGGITPRQRDRHRQSRQN